jgi:hypothetical protein
MFWLDADWSPPIPSVFLLAIYASALIALACWMWGGALDDQRTTGETGVQAPGGLE